MKNLILKYCLFVCIPFVLLLGSCEKEHPKEEELPLHQRYGLGKTLTAEHSNNVSYEWYINQNTTGEYENTNCGPTCITMVCKWANPNFTKTVEEARNDYLHISNEGWSWILMGDYLTDNKIDYEWNILSDENFLKNVIDNGHICILALKMYYIRMGINTSTWRIDRFYDVLMSSAHYIVIKGYKIVDDIIWFEVYDPASGWYIYEDGTWAGRDRYYRGAEIINAVTIYHNDARYEHTYMLVVQKTLPTPDDTMTE